MAIKDQERAEWAHHPVTLELLLKIDDAIAEAMEHWSREEYVGETPELTAVKNAKALGGIQSLRSVLEIVNSYKELYNVETGS